MTIKALYKKYKDMHVIYSFVRKGVHIHVQVLTPKERILIDEHIIEMEV